MADLFSDEQIAMFKKKFSRFVKDAGGTIKTKYVEKVMHSLELDTREEETAGMIKKVTRMVDADGKGTINFEQFLSLIKLMADFVNEEGDGLPRLLDASSSKNTNAREPREPRGLREPRSRRSTHFFLQQALLLPEQMKYSPPSRVVDKDRANRAGHKLEKRTNAIFDASDVRSSV